MFVISILVIIGSIEMWEVGKVVAFFESSGPVRGREVVDLPDELEGLTIIAMIHNE
jgi:hypothetical protein